jgi:predicted GNAT family N-acyltransferase
MHEQDKGILLAGTIAACYSEHKISYETQFRLLQLTETVFVLQAQCRKGGTDRQTDRQTDRHVVYFWSLEAQTTGMARQLAKLNYRLHQQI